MLSRTCNLELGALNTMLHLDTSQLCGVPENVLTWGYGGMGDMGYMGYGNMGVWGMGYSVNTLKYCTLGWLTIEVLHNNTHKDY